MNILWAGQEDISFPNGNPIYYMTGGVSGYARAAMANNSTSSVGTWNVSPCISKSFIGGSVTSCVYRFTITYTAGSTYTYPNGPLTGLTYEGAANGAGLYVGTGATRTKLRLITWDGTDQEVLATEVGDSLTAGTHVISMHITDYGTSANVKVYIDANDTPIIDYTGDVRISGLTALNRIAFFGNAGGNGCGFSEMIVADENCHSSRLVTRYGESTDAGNEWNGSHADVDEQVNSDADAMYTNTIDKHAVLGLSALPEGSFAVDAIVIAARAIAPSGAAANKIQLGADDGAGVDLDSGQNLTTSWLTYERLAHTLNGSQIDPASTLKLVMRSDAAA